MKVLTLFLVTALILAIACTGEPEVIVVTPTPDPTPATQSDADVPTPKPTVPRIDFSPTEVPQTSADTSSPDTPKPTHTPPPQVAPHTVTASQPAHHGAEHPEARLIPNEPEFDDSITLDQIYQQIDFQAYALDSQGPIDWFQEPNCDYGGRIPTGQGFDRHKVYFDVHQVNTAICDPYQVDLNHEVLKDGSYSNWERFHHPPHFVLNTSPAETIANHPYRFAFKNAHILAMHDPDAQRLKFSANYLPTMQEHLGEARLQGLAAGYEDAGLNPPTHLIGPEDWLAQSWYANIDESEHEDDRAMSALALFPNESVRDTIADAVADLLERAAPDADSGLELTQFNTDLDAPVTLSLKHATTKANQSYNEYHLAQWEFLSPYLPIVRVTTYNEQRFPYEGMTTYTKYDKYGFRDGTYEDIKVADSLEDHPHTRYAVSFVVAFQQRWNSFDDETRHEMYEDDDDDHQHAGEEYLNRWYATDMMLHSIIGPIVVQIYESPHLTPGVYSKNPEKSQWEKPGYIGASDPESYWHNFGINLPADVHDYIDYIDDPKDWPKALGYGHRHLGGQAHQPLPGEIALTHTRGHLTFVNPDAKHCRNRERWSNQRVCYQIEADFLARANAHRFHAFRVFELPQYADHR